jgi:YVTN family beta-propeller protein
MKTFRRAVFTLILASFVLASFPAVAQTVIAVIPLPAGSQPGAVAVNPATDTIYVANRANGSVTVIDGTTNTALGTVTVGTSPVDVAVNAVTDKVYVANSLSNNVTVINGITLQTVTVSTGTYPTAIAVNPVTNKIYVANKNSNNVTVIDGASNSTATVAVGTFPVGVAVNSRTNKIYVANEGDPLHQLLATVTVIDGANNNTTEIDNVGKSPVRVAVNSQTNKIYFTSDTDNTLVIIDAANNNSVSKLTVGSFPIALGIDPITNKIYVANQAGQSVSVVDGNGGLLITNVPVGDTPAAVTVDAVTNKIYVANTYGNSVTMIDGDNNGPTTVAVGTRPSALAANPQSNRVFVANSGSDNVTVIAGANAAPLRFVPLTPCRVADTRPSNGGGGPILGGTSQDFPVSGVCAVPGNAIAYSLNVTVVPHGSLGFITVWPTGEDQPLVSTTNSLDGRVKANAAIIPAGSGGEVSAFAKDTTDLVLDIDGYFLPASGGSTYAFFPLTPCRVADTRNPNGPLGGPFLTGGEERDFPVLEATACNIPSTAIAYSLNFTAVPHKPLGYLTVWPAGQQMPLVSTLNALTGAVTANAAIVPAGNDPEGSIAVYPKDDTDLVIDINGYFGPIGSGPTPLSLYSVAPCRVLDTRNPGGGGAFKGELTIDVDASLCGIAAEAQSFVLNATVVPSGPLGYLTLWPDGEQQPVVSTLNALDGAVTSNMAIVPTTNGKIDAWAETKTSTQLVIDSFSYFAP